MIRSPALALIGAMAFTTTSQIHPPADQLPPALDTYVAPAEVQPADIGRTGHASIGRGAETLSVYYVPLSSTEVSKYLGFGVAYHMAIVYTDANGRSFGASARPSNFESAMTPANAARAILFLASDEPSSFGTLIADPRNNKAFVKGSAGDFYTKDNAGHPYPHTLVLRGRNLSAQWTAIMRTYDTVDRLGLTYSPTSQNSNSVAGTALRRAHVSMDFSSNSYFAPGMFTPLPEPGPMGG